MGDVDLNIRLMMVDQANATQLLMQTRRALAVPNGAFVATLMLTANVVDVLTSGQQVINNRRTAYRQYREPLKIPSQVV